MEEAVRCALAGDCIVYPTTTQPALGCLPESTCLDQLYRLKGRASDVLVSCLLYTSPSPRDSWARRCV